MAMCRGQAFNDHFFPFSFPNYTEDNQTLFKLWTKDTTNDISHQKLCLNFTRTMRKDGLTYDISQKMALLQLCFFVRPCKSYVFRNLLSHKFSIHHQCNQMMELWSATSTNHQNLTCWSFQREKSDHHLPQVAQLQQKQQMSTICLNVSRTVCSINKTQG